MRAMLPSEPLFWGIMSLGVIAGFIVAYPVNVWLVKRRLKHGLMTERKPGFSVRSRPRPRVSPWASRLGAQPEAYGSRRTCGRSRRGSRVGRESAGWPSRDADRRDNSPAGSCCRVTVLILATGLIVPGFYVNLSLSAHDVGGAIMPPGMIMDFDTPAAAMRDMAAIHPRQVAYRASRDARATKS
jgi:hypothetical protein